MLIWARWSIAARGISDERYDAEAALLFGNLPESSAGHAQLKASIDRLDLQEKVAAKRIDALTEVLRALGVDPDTLDVTALAEIAAAASHAETPSLALGAVPNREEDAAAHHDPADAGEAPNLQHHSPLASTESPPPATPDPNQAQPRPSAARIQNTTGPAPQPATVEQARQMLARGQLAEAINTLESIVKDPVQRDEAATHLTTAKAHYYPKEAGGEPRTLTGQRFQRQLPAPWRVRAVEDPAHAEVLHLSLTDDTQSLSFMLVWNDENGHLRFDSGQLALFRPEQVRTFTGVPLQAVWANIARVSDIPVGRLAGQSVGAGWLSAEQRLLLFGLDHPDLTDALADPEFAAAWLFTESEYSAVHADLSAAHPVWADLQISISDNTITGVTPDNVTVTVTRSQLEHFADELDDSTRAILRNAGSIEQRRELLAEVLAIPEILAEPDLTDDAAEPSIAADSEYTPVHYDLGVGLPDSVQAQIRCVVEDHAYTSDPSTIGSPLVRADHFARKHLRSLLDTHRRDDVVAAVLAHLQRPELSADTEHAATERAAKRKARAQHERTQAFAALARGDVDTAKDRLRQAERIDPPAPGAVEDALTSVRTGLPDQRLQELVEQLRDQWGPLDLREGEQFLGVTAENRVENTVACEVVVGRRRFGLVIPTRHKLPWMVHELTSTGDHALRPTSLHAFVDRVDTAGEAISQIRTYIDKEEQVREAHRQALADRAQISTTKLALQLEAGPYLVDLIPGYEEVGQRDGPPHIHEVHQLRVGGRSFSLERPYFDLSAFRISLGYREIADVPETEPGRVIEVVRAAAREDAHDHALAVEAARSQTIPNFAEIAGTAAANGWRVDRVLPTSAAWTAMDGWHNITAELHISGQIGSTLEKFILSWKHDGKSWKYTANFSVALHLARAPKSVAKAFGAGVTREGFGIRADRVLTHVGRNQPRDVPSLLDDGSPAASTIDPAVGTDPGTAELGLFDLDDSGDQEAVEASSAERRASEQALLDRVEMPSPAGHRDQSQQQVPLEVTAHATLSSDERMVLLAVGASQLALMAGSRDDFAKYFDAQITTALPPVLAHLRPEWAQNTVVHVNREGIRLVERGGRHVGALPSLTRDRIREFLDAAPAPLTAATPAQLHAWMRLVLDIDELKPGHPWPSAHQQLWDAAAAERRALQALTERVGDIADEELLTYLHARRHRLTIELIGPPNLEYDRRQAAAREDQHVADVATLVEAGVSDLDQAVAADSTALGDRVLPAELSVMAAAARARNLEVDTGWWSAPGQRATPITAQMAYLRVGELSEFGTRQFEHVWDLTGDRRWRHRPDLARVRYLGEPDLRRTPMSTLELFAQLELPAFAAAVHPAEVEHSAEVVDVQDLLDELERTEEIASRSAQPGDWRETASATLNFRRAQLACLDAGIALPEPHTDASAVTGVPDRGEIASHALAAAIVVQVSKLASATRAKLKTSDRDSANAVQSALRSIAEHAATPGGRAIAGLAPVRAAIDGHSGDLTIDQQVALVGIAHRIAAITTLARSAASDPVQQLNSLPQVSEVVEGLIAAVIHDPDLNLFATSAAEAVYYRYATTAATSAVKRLIEQPQPTLIDETAERELLATADAVFVDHIACAAAPPTWARHNGTIDAPVFWPSPPLHWDNLSTRFGGVTDHGDKTHTVSMVIAGHRVEILVDDSAPRSRRFTVHSDGTRLCAQTSASRARLQVSDFLAGETSTQSTRVSANTESTAETASTPSADRSAAPPDLGGSTAASWTPEQRLMVLALYTSPAGITRLNQLHAGHELAILTETALRTWVVAGGTIAQTRPEWAGYSIVTTSTGIELHDGTDVVASLPLPELSVLEQAPEPPKAFDTAEEASTWLSQVLGVQLVGADTSTDRASEATTSDQPRWPISVSGPATDTTSGLAEELRKAVLRCNSNVDTTALTLARNCLTDTNWAGQEGPAGHAAHLADDDVLARSGVSRQDIDARIAATSALADWLEQHGYGEVRVEAVKDRQPLLVQVLRDYVTGYTAARAATPEPVHDQAFAAVNPARTQPERHGWVYTQLELARAAGWDVEIDTDDSGGVRAVVAADLANVGHVEYRLRWVPGAKGLEFLGKDSTRTVDGGEPARTYARRFRAEIETGTVLNGSSSSNDGTHDHGVNAAIAGLTPAPNTVAPVTPPAVPEYAAAAAFSTGVA
ncbi:hypothetical protein ACIGO9_31445 [Nocardia asteroides]|uniref:hypothetical protein n=1 Tax=Nocardia asteroides TaxID=1824 RepID=UPI0037C8DD49